MARQLAVGQGLKPSRYGYPVSRPPGTNREKAANPVRGFPGELLAPAASLAAKTRQTWTVLGSKLKVSA